MMNARDILEVQSKDSVVHLMWEERKWVACKITPRFLTWVGGFMNGGDSSPEKGSQEDQKSSQLPRPENLRHLRTQQYTLHNKSS